MNNAMKKLILLSLCILPFLSHAAGNNNLPPLEREIQLFIIPDPMRHALLRAHIQNMRLWHQHVTNTQNALQRQEHRSLHAPAHSSKKDVQHFKKKHR